MAGSPEVIEILGEEPARLRWRRYGAIARAAEACALWAGGFYRDAAEAIESQEELALPPAIRLLSAAWPPREASRKEIVSALGEDKVFARPPTALAYLLDVLVWMDAEMVARRPRDSYLRLFGAMESAVSYLIEALRRRPGGLEVEASGLARLERELPADPQGATIDWLAALYQAVLGTLRRSSATALAALAAGESEVIAELDFRRLAGERAEQETDLPPALTVCRVTAPLAERQRRAVKRARQVYYRFADLRHKAVHWMAPVPPAEAEKLRLGFRDFLRDLLPIALEAFQAHLDLPEREELEDWTRRLLAAASGEIPTDCRPPLFAELEARLGETFRGQTDIS